MNKLSAIIFYTFLSCIIISGCAPQKMYYFGDYSQTSYICKKDLNDESLLKHKQELESIIVESEARDLPIPPGIYAELGYLNYKSNNTKEAVTLFQKEYPLYPESTHVLERLIQSAELRKGKPGTEISKQSSSEENPSKKDI